MIRLGRLVGCRVRRAQNGRAGTLGPSTPLVTELTNAAPNAPMLGWVSTTSAPIAALGGTIHAFPPTAMHFRVSAALGNGSETNTWPAGVPSGVDDTLQFLVQDFVAVPGWIALSNAVRKTTP